LKNEERQAGRAAGKFDKVNQKFFSQVKFLTVPYFTGIQKKRRSL